MGNAHPCPDCRQCLTNADKCRYCAERDQLRAENAALCKVNQSHADYYEIREERDQLRDTVAGLRRALEEALQSAYPQPVEHPTMTAAWKVGHAALAASPDEHARKLNAEAYRDLCDGLLFWVDADVKQMLRMEADRLEAENGR